MDKSGQHLKDVDQQIDQIEKGFCMRLCCSSKKRKKRKSKNNFIQKSEEKSFVGENDPIYSNNQLKNLDESLQKLQYFNHLIDYEIQDQIQTLVCVFFPLQDIYLNFFRFRILSHNHTDLDSQRLIKTNFKTRHL